MQNNSFYVTESDDDGSDRTYWRCSHCPNHDTCSEQAWGRARHCTTLVSMEPCCELISEHLQGSCHHLMTKDDADGVAWALGLAAVEAQIDTADDRIRYR